MPRRGPGAPSPVFRTVIGVVPVSPGGFWPWQSDAEVGEEDALGVGEPVEDEAAAGVGDR